MQNERRDDSTWNEPEGRRFLDNEKDAAARYRQAHKKSITPYTTKTGIQIGIRYEAPMPGMYRDDELVQAAMLGIKRTKMPSLVVVSIAVVVSYFLLGVMKDI